MESCNKSDNKSYNKMQLAKRRFFAMRNGVVADALRKGGSPFSIIFGVNLPQLTEMASELGPDCDLALELWANATTRESRLLAPMLMEPAEFPRAMAEEWCAQVETPEVADVLCLRLLRRMPYALDLALALLEADADMERYVGARLMCNLAPQHPAQAAAAGRKELARQCALTRQPAQILITYGEE